MAQVLTLNTFSSQPGIADTIRNEIGQVNAWTVISSSITFTSGGKVSMGGAGLISAMVARRVAGSSGVIASFALRKSDTNPGTYGSRVHTINHDSSQPGIADTIRNEIGQVNAWTVISSSITFTSGGKVSMGGAGLISAMVARRVAGSSGVVRGLSQKYISARSDDLSTITTTKTIGGVAYLSATTTQTITGKAALNVQVNRTIDGTAHLLTEQAITGIADIESTILRTIEGKAAIEDTIFQTIDGVSRIQYTTPQTQDGIARIFTNQTIEGIANIQATTDRPQDGLAAIQLTVDRTLTGAGDIRVTTTRTILGVAYLAINTLQTIDGVSNITATTQKTITGKASIFDGQHIPGKASILNTTQRTQTGKAWLNYRQTQTQTGKAYLLHSATMSGRANIYNTTLQTLTGIAKISDVTIRTQTGKADIEKAIPQLLLGITRIKYAAQVSNQTGKGSIASTVLKTNTGIAMIAGSINRANLGVANIWVACRVWRTYTVNRIGAFVALRLAQNFRVAHQIFTFIVKADSPNVFNTDQDPVAKLTYVIDWSLWLGPGDSINAVAWTIVPASTPPTNLVIHSSSYTDTTARVVLKEGLVGTTYSVKAKITTVCGEVDARTILLHVVDR